MKLAERTYLDKAGMATTDRSRGVVLLGNAGKIIDDDDAARVGLKERAKGADKAVRKPKTKQITIPMEKT